MSQGNETRRNGYYVSARVRALADDFVAAILEEVPVDQHHNVVVPSAMFEVFMAYLRNGAAPDNIQASHMVGRGAVSMLEGISASSTTALPANWNHFRSNVIGWYLDALRNPTVEVIEPAKPRKEAS